MNAAFKIGAIVLALPTSLAFGQSDRAATWEFGGSVVSFSSVNVSGSNGAGLDVASEIGYGIFGAYHFTNRLSVGFDASFSDPKYRATLVPDGPEAPTTIQARLGVDAIQFKGTFNLLDNDITPFVELGAGWTHVDSNIISGYGGQVCWWDPWWGYVCSNVFDTYTETRASYSYGVGVRWDIDSEWVFKASWALLDIDSKAAEDIEVDTIQLTFGWRF